VIRARPSLPWLDLSGGRPEVGARRRGAELDGDDDGGGGLDADLAVERLERPRNGAEEAEEVQGEAERLWPCGIAAGGEGRPAQRAAAHCTTRLSSSRARRRRGATGISYGRRGEWRSFEARRSPRWPTRGHGRRETATGGVSSSKQRRCSNGISVNISRFQKSSS